MAVISNTLSLKTQTRNMSTNIESDDTDLLAMESISLDEETWAAIRCSCNSEDEGRLEKAMEKSVETGQLTPLVKEELWCFIQRRRLASGSEEMTVDFPTSREDDVSNVTPNDCKRRLARMEQNRRAARKYRNKKKQNASELEQEVTRLELSNTALRRESDCLQEEKNCLTQILLLHMESCQETVYPESLS